MSDSSRDEVLCDELGYQHPVISQPIGRAPMGECITTFRGHIVTSSIQSL